MRVLVCGGREFNNSELLSRVLEQVDAETSIDVIIEGGARGADKLAFAWALKKRRGSETYPADWNEHGKAAGHIRNREMLDKGKPDLVVAFPGGRGTANMVQQAIKRGVRVIEANPGFLFETAGKTPPSTSSSDSEKR